MHARLARFRWRALVAGLFAIAQGCAQTSGTAAPAPLENTYWKLVQLRGEPLSAPADRREPHLVMVPGERPSANGSGGCNRFVGGYRVAGETIAFERLASTMMACDAVMAREQAYFAALGAAKSWTIQGKELLLRDAEGKPLARFEASQTK